jgi:hypothetical protein
MPKWQLKLLKLYLMPIVVPPAISAHIASIEAAMVHLDDHAYCSTLDALVSDAASLTVDERRGCFAEIQAHRFVLTTETDRGPWGIRFGPVSTSRMANGTVQYGPDANGVDLEMIDYWGARSEATPHPVMRARYADLSWEMTILWKK